MTPHTLPSILAAALLGAATLPAAEDPAGRRVYDQHCAACHGANGDGNGPASVWLFPKPRNFSAGLFKIQSTPAGSLPTDEDLFQTVTRGMPGSSMPSFTYLSEQERREAVLYVKYLTATTDAQGKRNNKFEEAAKGGAAPKPVQVAAEPTDLVASISLGKQLFMKNGCFACHGETGAGNGPAAMALRDAQGIPVYPRDFNTGSFRGGSTGRDIYLRIHNGLAGTPMPAYGEAAMKPDERWALVHYILSLRRKDIEVNDLLASVDGAIRMQQVPVIPENPADPTWESFDPVRVPLNPLWPEPQPIPAVSVIAVHDGRTAAFHLSWRDPSVNGESVRVQEFQDEVAMQFSLDGTTPFLGMGDKDHPVNLWLWRAGWQQEIEGKRPDMKDEYPSMHVDTYLDTNELYLTAVKAGNPISRQHASAVEDANARGFGTLTSQPVAQQNVNGRGIWFDGSWSVVITRDLASSEPGDVKFASGAAIPVAFAVWNGEQRDRNGRKVVSNWIKVIVEKAAQTASTGGAR
jgi:mono/diheme cytochrome c family protein